MKTGYGRFVWHNFTFKTHRVAAWLWKGFLLDSPLCICHHCDNRRCFNPEHLFIGTHADNIRDRDLKGRAAKPQGTKQWNAKLTEEQIPEIVALRKRGYKLSQIADLYGVCFQLISTIVKGKVWKHVKREAV